MLKRSLRSNVFLNFISWVIAGYFKLVYATSRFERVNPELAADNLQPGLARILVFWHGRIAMLPYAKPRKLPLHVLISLHGDGEFIARVIARMGVDAIRGSTERKGRAQDKGGAQALRAMVKLLRAGGSVGITPDGPRGPGMRASSGTILLARLSGVPLFPLVYATSRRRILGSWDRFHFPLPFSKGVILYGPLIEVPRTGADELYESKRLELETALNDLTAQADRLLGHDAVLPASELATGDQVVAG
jgi:lysophospholipid acyltransferase (LPLAT)-like uncharacterized protein